MNRHLHPSAVALLTAVASLLATGWIHAEAFAAPLARHLDTGEMLSVVAVRAAHDEVRAVEAEGSIARGEWIDSVMDLELVDGSARAHGTLSHLSRETSPTEREVPAHPSRVVEVALLAAPLTGALRRAVFPEAIANLSRLRGELFPARCAWLRCSGVSQRLAHGAAVLLPLAPALAIAEGEPSGDARGGSKDGLGTVVADDHAESVQHPGVG